MCRATRSSSEREAYLSDLKILAVPSTFVLHRRSIFDEHLHHEDASKKFSEITALNVLYGDLFVLFLSLWICLNASYFEAQNFM